MWGMLAHITSFFFKNVVLLFRRKKDMFLFNGKKEECLYFSSKVQNYENLILFYFYQ